MHFSLGLHLNLVCETGDSLPHAFLGQTLRHRGGSRDCSDQRERERERGTLSSVVMTAADPVWILLARSLWMPAVPTLAAEQAGAVGNSCQLSAYWEAVWRTQMRTTDLLHQQQSTANPFLLLWTELNHKYHSPDTPSPPHTLTLTHTHRESGGVRRTAEGHGQEKQVKMQVLLFISISIKSVLGLLFEYLMNLLQKLADYYFFREHNF